MSRYMARLEVSVTLNGGAFSFMQTMHAGHIINRPA